jgi:hypothetical protein
MTAVPAYGFSDQDKADIRRFLGYPPQGTGAVIFPEQWVFPSYLALEARLNNLLAAEAQTVMTYLGQLRTIEAAIPSVGDNADTLKAAVWEWNPRELRDRMNLYRTWRLELCATLGMTPGPHLQPSSGGMRCVI